MTIKVRFRITPFLFNCLWRGRVSHIKEIQKNEKRIIFLHLCLGLSCFLVLFGALNACPKKSWWWNARFVIPYPASVPTSGRALISSLHDFRGQNCRMIWERNIVEINGVQVDPNRFYPEGKHLRKSLWKFPKHATRSRNVDMMRTWRYIPGRLRYSNTFIHTVCQHLRPRAIGLCVGGTSCRPHSLRQGPCDILCIDNKHSVY